MAIYLKIDGIQGDATESNHTNWVTVDSYQFSTAREVKARIGNTAIREFSEPSVSDFTLTKPLDKASGGIFREALVGNQGKTHQIDVTSTGQGGTVLLTYVLSNVMVSNYHISSGGERPIESITLNFSKVEVTFNPIGGSRSVTSYDLATNKAS
jgi:type VI secretion system secreted protein Hcp